MTGRSRPRRFFADDPVIGAASIEQSFGRQGRTWINRGAFAVNLATEAVRARRRAARRRRSRLATGGLPSAPSAFSQTIYVPGRKPGRRGLHPSRCRKKTDRSAGRGLVEKSGQPCGDRSSSTTWRSLPQVTWVIRYPGPGGGGKTEGNVSSRQERCGGRGFNRSAAQGALLSAQLGGARIRIGAEGELSPCRIRPRQSAWIQGMAGHGFWPGLRPSSGSKGTVRVAPVGWLEPNFTEEASHDGTFRKGMPGPSKAVHARKFEGRYRSQIR